MTDKETTIVKSEGAMVRSQGFSSTELATTGETVSSVLAARAKAEVEARFIVAMKRPRDLDVVRTKLLKACERPGFAGSATEKSWGAAWYKKPIGEGVEGFSIFFAKEALRCLGNMDAKSWVIWEDDIKRLVQVEVMDLETNVSIPTVIVVDKTVERKFLKKGEEAISVRVNSKNEPTYLRAATEDEVMQKQNSLISKATRNGIMSLLPGDIQAECRARILAIRQGALAKDPEGFKRKVIDGFARHNIGPNDLKWYLGHDIGTCSQMELSALRDLWKEIDDGNLTWAQVIKDVSEERGEKTKTEEEPEPQGLEKLKRKVRSKQEVTKEPDPEPKIEQEIPSNRDPVIVSDNAFNVFEELDSTLKAQYGNKAGERLKYLAKKAGFKSDALSETEACVLLDLLNSEERLWRF